jgi:hypothetical protein
MPTATQCRPLRLLLSVLAGVVGMHIYLYSLESRPAAEPSVARCGSGTDSAGLSLRCVCVCVVARRTLPWLEADEDGRLHPRHLSDKPGLIWPVFW